MSPGCQRDFVGAPTNGAPTRVDGVEYRPNQIWIYDTTHFTCSKSALTIVEDLVSRKWIAHIVSSEETSTQVEIVFTDALEAEGLLALVEARADQVIDPDIDDERLPILLAVSDNGPQTTSISTRKFMALGDGALPPGPHPGQDRAAPTSRTDSGSGNCAG